MHYRLRRRLRSRSRAHNALADLSAFANDRDDFQNEDSHQHVVVIFQETFRSTITSRTYPHAFNLPGETPFHAAEDTLSPTLFYRRLLPNNPKQGNPFRNSTERCR